jgi:hypothetical protein
VAVKNIDIKSMARRAQHVVETAVVGGVPRSPPKFAFPDRRDPAAAAEVLRQVRVADCGRCPHWEVCLWAKSRTPANTSEARWQGIFR